MAIKGTNEWEMDNMQFMTQSQPPLNIYYKIEEYRLRTHPTKILKNKIIWTFSHFH